MSSRRPTLVLIAGPNGSGKTTLTKDLRGRAWFREFTYVNPDAIAQERFGDWNSPEARRKAAILAASIVNRALRDRANLALETVLASGAIPLLRRARAATYLIRLYYIGTSDPAINIARVVARTQRGGHDIPTPDILRRYRQSIANLHMALALADHGHVYDNSVEDVPMTRLVQTLNGTISRQFVAQLPVWVGIPPMPPRVPLGE